MKIIEFQESVSNPQPLGYEAISVAMECFNARPVLKVTRNA